MIDRTRDEGARPFRGLRVALASLALATLAACAGEESGSADRADGRKNLLFIAVDTLRADHLSCYGFERETSPNIDALAASGVRFERAFSAAPWTRPSVATMLTGLYPETHGAYQVRIPLADESTTLAEVLKVEGYATAGIVSHKIISTEFGFDQGFDTYDDSEGQGHNHVSTANVTRLAIEKLDELAAGDDPFFLFLHFFDPHYNYRDHREYDWAPDQVGRLNGKQSIGQLRTMELDRKEAHFLTELYDEEIAHTDAGIGRVLDRLDELGLRDDTIVVLTADHGEEFLEHGWLGHTVHLYDHTLHVPLIVRVPGTEPHVVEEPVSLVSLMPTLLDVLRVPWTALNLQGRPLTGLLVGREADDTAPLYASVDFIPTSTKRDPDLDKTTKLRGLIGADFKFIVDGATGEVELYDLVQDPLENRNLASEQPERVEELRRLLEAKVRAIEARQPPRIDESELTPEEVRQMEALGY